MRPKTTTARKGERMAEIIKRSTDRKVSVKKRKQKEENGRCCIVCGNTNEMELAYYYNDGVKMVRTDFCKYLGSCAGLVSTFLKSSN
jgi:hypothetical protein